MTIDWTRSPITLWDYYAGQAMSGDLTAQSIELGIWEENAPEADIKGRALLYGRFADAMLAERAKREKADDFAIDWTKPIETVPCERNPEPVPCRCTGSDSRGRATVYIGGLWVPKSGSGDVSCTPWTYACDGDPAVTFLPRIRNRSTEA